MDPSMTTPSTTVQLKTEIKKRAALYKHGVSAATAVGKEMNAWLEKARMADV